MMRIRVLACVLTISTICAGGIVNHASAQQGSERDTVRRPSEAAPRTQPASPQAPPVQVVLSKMHALNQMEMQVGQIAAERGGEEAVRRYGTRLFRDHRFADSKVTALAEEKGIELLPLPRLPGDQAKMMQLKQKAGQLQNMQGAQLDRMFLPMMVQAHTVAITTLDQALSMLDDAAVSTLIKRVVPILGQHRSLAQHLQQAASETSQDRQEAERVTP